MPTLDPNLLYTAPQQTKPWRAGTPGRAPRYRRAVVDFRWPLRLFMATKLALAALLAALAATPQPTAAQENSNLPTVQIRLGAMLFTPLVKQTVREVRDSSLGATHAVSVRQQPAPVFSAAVIYPLRERLTAELSASFARSTLQGEDDLGEWKAADLSVLNAVLCVRYQRMARTSIDFGVGVTKLAGSSTGMFTKGNGLRPLFEGGVTTDLPTAWPLQLVVRAQTHSFTTGTLQDEGADAGQVWRGALQLATSFGRKR
jgi:hypothetical protein